MEDKVLKNVLDDNFGLFRQCMKLMNQCQDAEERLEEAEKLLKEWKDFVYQSFQLSMISSYHFIKKRELDERTDRLLKKEGKNERER